MLGRPFCASWKIIKKTQKGFLDVSNFLTLSGRKARFCIFFLEGGMTALTFAAKINSSPYVQTQS